MYAFTIMQTASSRTRTVRFLLNFLCLCFGFFLGVNLTVYFRLFSLNMSHIDVTDDGLPFDEKINLIHLSMNFYSHSYFR